MRKEELRAESISVEKPCSESWDEMSGDDKTRACSHCRENVNDISMMTEAEAFELIAESNGNLCVRFEAHPQTNVPIFADKLYQITRQTGVTAGVLGATLAVTASSANANNTDSSVNNLNSPTTTISSVKNSGTSNKKVTSPKVSPTPPIKRPPKIMGKIRIRNYVRKPLHRAVQQGKTLKVRLMIAKGTDVNEVDTRYYSRTALHVAVENNNLKMAEILLNAGANIEAKDKYFNTPLMNLRWTVTDEMIRLLVSHGANLNEKNRSGRTALMNAAQMGNLRIVKALLESGADANVQDSGKYSALDLTTSEEVKQILIAYGAERKSL